MGLQDFYSKLNQQERMIFYGAIAVLVLAFFDMLFLRPVFSRLNELEEGIRNTSRAIEMDARFISYRDKIFMEDDAFRIYETGEGTTGEEIIAGFLKKIEGLASESKIALSRVTPGDVISRKGFVLFFANVECSGKLEDMITFMHRIDSTENLLKITRVSMSGNKASKDDVRVEMKVSRLVIDPSTVGNYEFDVKDVQMPQALLEETAASMGLSPEGKRISEEQQARSAGSGGSGKRGPGGQKGSGSGEKSAGSGSGTGGGEGEGAGGSGSGSGTGAGGSGVGGAGGSGSGGGTGGGEGEGAGGSGSGSGAGAGGVGGAGGSGSGGGTGGSGVGGAGGSGTGSGTGAGGSGVGGTGGTGSGGGTGAGGSGVGGTGGTGSGSGTGAGGGGVGGAGGTGAGGVGGAGGSGSGGGSAGGPGGAGGSGGQVTEDIFLGRTSQGRRKKSGTEYQGSDKDIVEEQPESAPKVGGEGRVRVDSLDMLWDRFVNKFFGRNDETVPVDEGYDDKEDYAPPQETRNLWEKKLLGR